MILGVGRRYGQIESLLKPRSNAIGELGSDLIGMIGDDRSRVVGQGASFGGEVIVDHQIEDSGRRDLSVVDLDLVGLSEHEHRHRGDAETDNSSCTQVHSWGGNPSRNLFF